MIVPSYTDDPHIAGTDGRLAGREAQGEEAGREPDGEDAKKPHRTEQRPHRRKQHPAHIEKRQQVESFGLLPARLHDMVERLLLRGGERPRHEVVLLPARHEHAETVLCPRHPTRYQAHPRAVDNCRASAAICRQDHAGNHGLGRVRPPRVRYLLRRRQGSQGRVPALHRRRRQHARHRHGEVWQFLCPPHAVG